MQLLARFQADHLDARGVSADRQRAQLRVIKAFGSWIGARGLLAADGDLLVAFLASRAGAGKGAGTIRKERAMLLSFYRGHTDKV